MKIVQDPKVYLISRPHLNWEGIREFLNGQNTYWNEDINIQMKKSLENPDFKYSNNTEGDLLPEFAGRICYCSFGDKGRSSNEQYLFNIINQGHGSVLEHSNFTFLVSQCSRGLTHELVRHRAGFAYSQESTHYIDYSEETGIVVLPAEIPNGTKNAAVEHLKMSFNLYQEGYKQLRAKKYAKKDACSIMRNIFPIALESKIVFTANIRALRHFIETRGTIHNIKDIRNLACQIYDIMSKEAPHCFKGISKFKDSDGFESIKTENRKV